MDGRAQGHSVGATVVGYRAALPSSPSTERKQMPSYNTGSANNSEPTTVWLPEKIGQSVRHTTENEVENNRRRDVSIMHESFDESFTHSSGDIICGQDCTNKNEEGEQQQITMLDVAAAISVSSAIHYPQIFV